MLVLSFSSSLEKKTIHIVANLGNLFNKGHNNPTFPDWNKSCKVRWESHLALVLSEVLDAVRAELNTVRNPPLQLNSMADNIRHKQLSWKQLSVEAKIAWENWNSFHIKTHCRPTHCWLLVLSMNNSFGLTSEIPFYSVTYNA